MRKGKGLASIIALLLSVCLALSSALATPMQRRTHPDFTTPPKLRARVDFWVDVFTRFGKAQMIVHHRDFPQVRFGIVDLSAESAGLSDAALERLKKLRGDQVIDSLRDLFKRLAAGEQPQNDFERNVVAQMSFLPGGLKKYKDMVALDLVRTQSGIREKYMDSLKRSGRYIQLMEDIFRDHALPIELTRLPFIESSFDYRAYSSVGAAGIWQFMRKTGMLYMRVNSLVDERRDPLESTRAAAKYLSEAYSKLGTWPLAIVSYNHGIFGVSRKVREAGTSNLAEIVEDPGERYFGFASTNFYPEFLAALEIYDNYSHYFPGLVLEPPLQLSLVKIPKSASVSYLAKQLQVDVESLRAVNYAVADRVWSGRNLLPAGYVLKVPKDRAQALASLRMPEHVVPTTVEAASSVYSGITYRVRKSDTLLSIAKKHRTSVATIRQLNSLKSDSLKLGQELIIKQAGAEQAAVPPQKREVPSRRSYKVKRGDNLWSIAKKQGVNVSDLKRLNGLNKNALKENQVLILP